MSGVSSPASALYRALENCRGGEVASAEALGVPAEVLSRWLAGAGVPSSANADLRETGQIYSIRRLRAAWVQSTPAEVNGTASDESRIRNPLADLDAFAEIAFLRRRLKRGESVFRAGDPFSAIYAVRSGCFKTAQADAAGREQVMGFFVTGEVFGLDGIGTGYHCTASALEDSEVIVLPFALMQDMARQNKTMQYQLHAVLSREITRGHGVMMLLGSMQAEARLGTFLLSLSTRFARLGYSPTDFVLRMTRQDIASYLGLKLETVSRLFSKFHKSGLLDVQQKHVRILDPQGLRRALAMP